MPEDRYPKLVGNGKLSLIEEGRVVDELFVSLGLNMHEWVEAVTCS